MDKGYFLMRTNSNVSTGYCFKMIFKSEKNSDETILREIFLRVIFMKPFYFCNIFLDTAQIKNTK